MKNKIYLYITIIFTISFLCGCAKKEEENISVNIYTDSEIIDKYNIAKDYDFKEAEKDGFVIYDSKKIINKDKIKEFYDNTISNKESSLTIIRYTKEEIPIIIQYNYSNGEFIVYEDTTREKNSDGKIISRKIKSIELEENNGDYEIIEKY